MPAEEHDPVHTDPQPRKRKRDKERKARSVRSPFCDKEEIYRERKQQRQRRHRVKGEKHHAGRAVVPAGKGERERHLRHGGIEDKPAEIFLPVARLVKPVDKQIGKDDECDPSDGAPDPVTDGRVGEKAGERQDIGQMVDEHRADRDQL